MLSPLNEFFMTLRQLKCGLLSSIQIGLKAKIYYANNINSIYIYILYLY